VRSGCAVGGKPPLRAGSGLGRLRAVGARETASASPSLPPAVEAVAGAVRRCRDRPSRVRRNAFALGGRSLIRPVKLVAIC